MLKTSEFYIDLGTANTLIYGRGRGFLLNEPSVITLRQRGMGQELFAVGRPAKNMLGKNPTHLSVHRPLREGVIADFESTARMLRAFIGRAKENLFWLRPKLVISLPCRVSRFEKEAVEQVGFDLGASRVHLIDEPVAAAIGAGLPVTDKRGVMVVDIGGGTTEIAIISCGGIVTSNAVRVGGDTIDTAIIDHIRNHFNFLIGEQTAERIKVEVGSALDRYALDATTEAGGIDTILGLPKRMSIRSQDIFDPIDSVVRSIIDAVYKSLEVVPPDIASDLADNGFVLAGGGALLHGLAERLSRTFGLKVTVSRDPLFSVAMGGAQALENGSLLEVIERQG